MIAAAVLGVIALVALWLAFGRSIFGGSTTTAANGSPTPKSSVTPSSNQAPTRMPTATERDFDYQTTVVDYRPDSAYAPDPGRNIFAFYEPPPPCPTCPTPYKPPPTPKPASPTPTPWFVATSMNPQSVYAGSRGFRLEVYGDRFTPDSHIYFSQSELPTTFINAQKLVTDIPSNFIAQEGPRQIIVQSPDGKKYSDQMILTVAAPPRPAFQYIGMIGRKRYNNDTAYFTEQGKTTPFGARLNDVVSGRFRLIDISPAEAIFEDTLLGFRHKLPISKSSTTGSNPSKSGFNDGGFIPVNPNDGNPCVPGIPCNIPRYVPPQPKKTPDKTDVDDDGDGGGN